MCPFRKFSKKAQLLQHFDRFHKGARVDPFVAKILCLPRDEDVARGILRQEPYAAITSIRSKCSEYFRQMDSHSERLVSRRTCVAPFFVRVLDGNGVFFWHMSFLVQGNVRRVGNTYYTPSFASLLSRARLPRITYQGIIEHVQIASTFKNPNALPRGAPFWENISMDTMSLRPVLLIEKNLLRRLVRLDSFSHPLS